MEAVSPVHFVETKGSTRIALTAGQNAHLETLFDKAELAHVEGKPGMILAQVFRTLDGTAYMEVGFIPHDRALTIGGAPPTLEKGDLVEVWVPDDVAQED